MNDDVVARRRAALVAAGISLEELAPGVLEDRPPPPLTTSPPALAPPAPADTARHGLPVEVIRPLSDQAYSILCQHLPDRANVKHGVRAVMNGWLLFVVQGATWHDLGGIDSGYFSACKRFQRRDGLRKARSAVAMADLDTMEKAHLLRTLDYLISGDWRLLSERPGLARYVARVTGRTQAVRAAAREASQSDTREPSRRAWVLR